ncbi:hypothetical protein KSP40_PGU006920 [Platanthera guangdongensis]|uniref:Uncharacterized protein n=1 Tax=Platanthera guangdongensis TaxID=2320717 RepID=A0ABR2M0J8_9ASPA
MYADCWSTSIQLFRFRKPQCHPTLGTLTPHSSPSSLSMSSPRMASSRLATCAS